MTTAQSKLSQHKWNFFRAGGVDQVKLATGADLLHLNQLDQKLWMVLSCPTRGLEFDNRTLDLIDTDGDGHIRVPELLTAINWAGSLLKSTDELVSQATELSLTAINETTEEGQQLLKAAKQILLNLGKPEANTISVEDTSDTIKIFAQTRFNGDGIIPADASEDPAIQSIITDIITCLGEETDRSGKPGINQEKADLFFTEAQAYADWQQLSESRSDILPLGAKTAEATALLRAVLSKIDDFFTRCRLAAFDPKAGSAINPQENAYLALTTIELSDTSQEISGFPIARIEAGASLPLEEGINPAWAAALKNLQTELVTPLFGLKTSLTEAEWLALKTIFAPFAEWSAQKPGNCLETLGLDRIREILNGNNRELINNLLAQDNALEPEANAIAIVERLVHYHRNLFKLANNFVSFNGFYTRQSKALFQAGTLYIDRRHCDLCIKVTDMGKHSATAHLSRAFLAYCDCIRKSTNETITIAAAFTDGDSDDLMVGRNGIFYDRQGQDWDATITKIVENPINIRQAFWSPYKRVIRLIEEMMAKRAATADAAAQGKLTDTVTSVDTAAETGKPGPAKPKFDVGVVAALGVAVGGITAALGAILQAFFGLGIWMPLGLVALILMISGPSMMIAWLKLRQRNLGPLLNANGWAVNTRACINIPFGASLTQVAKLPDGSSRSLDDPFADPTKLWPKLFVVLGLLIGLLCWFNYTGKLYQWTGFGKQPAPQAITPPATP